MHRLIHLITKIVLHCGEKQKVDYKEKIKQNQQYFANNRIATRISFSIQFSNIFFSSFRDLIYLAIIANNRLKSM